MRTALLLVAGCVLSFRLDAATPTPNDSQKIIITYPAGGETFKVGDTVSVQWVCIDNIISVDIRLSPDKGKTWILLNGQSVPYYDTTRWEHYKWVIPERIRKSAQDTSTFLLAGDHDCLFRVENYSPADKTEISADAQPVTVLARSGILVSGGGAARSEAFNVSAMLSRGAFRAGVSPSIRLFDARGRNVGVSKGMASGIIVGVISNDARPIVRAPKAAYLR